MNKKKILTSPPEKTGYATAYKYLKYLKISFRKNVKLSLEFIESDFYV